MKEIFNNMAKCREADQKWRRFIKSVIVHAMGGKCTCCGYNGCNSALEFHHLNPNEKDFGFGDYKYTINETRWPDIVKELKKCILVCSNCHREIHDNLITFPYRILYFNEDYADFSIIKNRR